MRWLLLALFLSSCGLSTLLPLGGSGGPTVNSNAQIGKENRQSVMSVEQTEEVTAGRDVIQNEIVINVDNYKQSLLKFSLESLPPIYITSSHKKTGFSKILSEINLLNKNLKK